MHTKFLPSFVKRRSRITKKQTKSLESLSKFSVNTIHEIIDLSAHFDKCFLEIGFGNAKNIIFQAINNPRSLFIGSEVYMSGIGTLVSSIKENKIKNIKVFSDDIRFLLDQGPKKVFDSVVIICPDPWPKDRHHKRRLLQNNFFDMLNKRMTAESKLFISTDWDNYADHISGSLKSKNHNFESRLISSIPLRDLSKFQKRAVTEGRHLHFFEVQKIR